MKEKIAALEVGQNVQFVTRESTLIAPDNQTKAPTAARIVGESEAALFNSSRSALRLVADAVAAGEEVTDMMSRKDGGDGSPFDAYAITPWLFDVEFSTRGYWRRDPDIRNARLFIVETSIFVKRVS